MSGTDLAADPAWFPDRVDAQHRLIRLVRTSHEILRDSAFVDGRTPLGTEPAATRTLSFDAFAEMFEGRPPPMRWIFHEAFCGSTLLARIATVEHVALCLREPQILNDLCNWRLRLPPDELPLYRRILNATLVALGRPWSHGEEILIKPSNRPNPIVDDLWDVGRGDRAIFARVNLESFLVAVLRGGGERIRYVLRFYQDLSMARPDLSRTVNAALRPRADPVAQAMQVVAGAHWAQAAILAECCARRGTNLEDCTLWFPGMLDDLPGAARRMADHLQLDIPAGSLDKSVERHTVLHSKNDGQPHDRAADETTNSRVRLEAGGFIQEGLDLLSRLSVT